MPKKKGQRKYLTEFNLNVYSSEPVIVAPADLGQIQDANDEIQLQVKNSNIYLILKRPRISFVPNSIEVVNGEVSGRLSVQTEEGAKEFPFSIPGALPENANTVKASKYPYTKLTLVSENGEDICTVPITFLLSNMNANLEGIDYLEVAYVGQAFGSAGERSAVERLSSHSTLQKILADITRSMGSDSIDHLFLVCLEKWSCWALLPNLRIKI